MNSPTPLSFDIFQFRGEQDNSHSFSTYEVNSAFYYDEQYTLPEFSGSFEDYIRCLSSTKTCEEETAPITPYKKAILHDEDAQQSLKIDVKIECSESATPETSIKPKRRYRKRAARKRISEEQKEEKKRQYQATKNLTKNYGSAITSFAGSKLAYPYYKLLLSKENLDSNAYYKYVKYAKKNTRTIEGFRGLILVNEADSHEVQACKRILQAMGIVFIKYFSVNWIMNGKLNCKMTYLKMRGRILRKIQDPSTFTSVIGDKEKKGKSPKRA